MTLMRFLDVIRGVRIAAPTNELPVMNMPLRACMFSRKREHAKKTIKHLAKRGRKPRFAGLISALTYQWSIERPTSSQDSTLSSYRELPSQIINHYPTPPLDHLLTMRHRELKARAQVRFRWKSRGMDSRLLARPETYDRPWSRARYVVLNTSECGDHPAFPFFSRYSP